MRMMVLTPEVKKPTSPGPGQRRGAHTAERLVAGHRAVGVDAHEVDVVGQMVEVGDHVAAGAHGRGAWPGCSRRGRGRRRR